VLSSFSEFRKHPSEQRRDPHEGASVLDISFGGQPLPGIAYFGGDAYIPSESMIESDELRPGGTEGGADVDGSHKRSHYTRGEGTHLHKGGNAAAPVPRCVCLRLGAP
jgi:hypothetical protein